MDKTNILPQQEAISRKNTATETEILKTKEEVNSLFTEDRSELFSKQFPWAKEHPFRQILTWEKNTPVQIYRQDIHEIGGIFQVPAEDATHFVTITVASHSQKSERIDFHQSYSEFQTMIRENCKRERNHIKQEERNLKNTLAEQAKDILRNILKENNVENMITKKNFDGHNFWDYSFYPEHLDWIETILTQKDSNIGKLFQEQTKDFKDQYMLLRKKWKPLEEFLNLLSIELYHWYKWAPEKTVRDAINSAISRAADANYLQEEMFQNHPITQACRAYIKKMEQIGFHEFDIIKHEGILGKEANAIIDMQDAHDRLEMSLQACEYERGYDLSTVYLKITQGDGRFWTDDKTYIPNPLSNGDHEHILPKLLQKIENGDIKNVVYIPQIEVHPDYQGKWYSGALLEGIKWFSEHGKYQADATYAIVENNNPQKDRMLASFRKAGYQIFPFRKENVYWKNRWWASLAIRIHPKKI